MPNGNRSIVVNYEGHDAYDAPGYVQFTLSAGIVFITVDGRPVGRVPEAEFATVHPHLFA